MLSDFISNTVSTALAYPRATLLSTMTLLGSEIYLYSHLEHLNQPKRFFGKKTVPVSVNYHFSRKCNADCVFCFHTATTSHVAPDEDAKRALRLLKHEGMRKLNFAGGEPFLYPAKLGSWCQFAKEELKLESVSIVSNGTRVKESWLRRWGKYVDILAISCDSFDPETNRKIGRAERGSGRPFDNVEQLFQIRDWCRELNIKFKLNTVINQLNWQEDMTETVKELAPFRWKVFQVLFVDGENNDEDKLRDARKVTITDEQFRFFCDRHQHIQGFTPEDNNAMRATYLILDEYLRFLSPGNGARTVSKPVLEVGVQKALAQSYWDKEGFKMRGAEYDWSKDAPGGRDGASCGGGISGVELKDLEY